jgi:hypothetical protein
VDFKRNIKHLGPIWQTDNMPFLHTDRDPIAEDDQHKRWPIGNVNKGRRSPAAGNLIRDAHHLKKKSAGVSAISQNFPLIKILLPKKKLASIQNRFNRIGLYSCRITSA